MAFRLARALRSAARVVPRVRVVHEPWSQLNVLAAAGIVLGSSVAACHLADVLENCGS